MEEIPDIIRALDGVQTELLIILMGLIFFSSGFCLVLLGTIRFKKFNIPVKSRILLNTIGPILLFLGLSVIMLACIFIFMALVRSVS
jgi:hypothetical protein